jgi:hypothetical protein
VPSWSVWQLPSMNLVLGVAVLAGWLWMMWADLVTTLKLRRIPARGELSAVPTWKGLVIAGLSLIFVSYTFLSRADTGIWYPNDYRNSDWWVLANQIVVVILGPALIAIGVAVGLRRRLGRGR